jgi:two-component system response regulator HydG
VTEPRTPRDDSTIVAAREPEGPLLAARYRLTVIRGPDAPKQFVVDGLQPLRLLVGQSPTCGLQLTDPRASRRHLALDATGNGLRMTDLGSKNGTWVNGLRTLDAFLVGTETIELGDSAVRVERIADEAAGALSSELRFGRLIGASPAMRKLYPLLTKLAAANVPLIIEGETGTGKELLAESLHEQGPRASGPFVVFDCTAVAPTLVESALFGHEKGAFTGAVSSRRGVFENADGGTLLIDEIGDLELSLQSKLLRAIERAEVAPVGGGKWVHVDVRVIAATRRDLDAEVAAKRFRDDLFFRLNVARVELPPLRAREGDVGVLARHFWRELGDDGSPLPKDFLEKLESYSWPGNVRELYNLVARRRALGELASPLPMQMPAAAGPRRSQNEIESLLAENLPFIRARDRLLEDFERRYVERALERFGGNVSRAAAASGIARRYFYDIKKRVGG